MLPAGSHSILPANLSLDVANLQWTLYATSFSRERVRTMGGPIVRSGASPKFSENWDKIFGGKPAGKKLAAKESVPAKKLAKKKSK